MEEARDCCKGRVSVRMRGREKCVWGEGEEEL